MQLEPHILLKLQNCAEQSGTLYIGFSGGLDSSVLLALLLEAGLAKSVHALHINHGLSTYASSWQRHCQQYCENLELKFSAIAVELEAKGGLEAAARQARYQAFESFVEDGDLLLTAHHLDDQAETLMLRLSRGAGLRGLAAMPEQRQLGRGHMLRPLLNCSRQQLERYARCRQINWVEDDSNTDTRFDRNFLRQKVFPLLRQRWPQFSRTSARCSALLQQELSLLETYMAEDLQRCDLRCEKLGQSLDLDSFSRFDASRQQAVLRYWLKSNGQDAPGLRQIQQVASLLLAAVDAQPQLDVGAWRFSRFQQRLYLLPRCALDLDFDSVNWTGQGRIDLGGGWAVEAQAPVALKLRLQMRSAPVRCKPLGRRHSQVLKKLLQEYAVAPWLRQCIPLVYMDDSIVAVGDVFFCDTAVQAHLAGLRWFWRAPFCVHLE